MLIQKSPNAGDIISVKLINGDELIAKLVVQDSATCTLAKPVIVDIRQSGPSQVALGFLPFLASANDDTNVTLPQSMILTKVTTRADVANNYRRVTSSLTIATPAETGLLQP